MWMLAGCLWGVLALLGWSAWLHRQARRSQAEEAFSADLESRYCLPETPSRQGSTRRQVSDLDRFQAGSHE